MKIIVTLLAGLLLLSGCLAEKNDSAVTVMQARIKENNTIARDEKPLKTVLDEKEQLRFRLDYARLLIKDNKISEAEHLLDSLRKDEAIAPDAYPLLAKVYELQKNWQNAYIAWDVACKLDNSHNIDLQSRLARAALLSEKYDIAEQIYQQWLSPVNQGSKKIQITALNNLGFTYLLQKKYEQAEIYLKQALELDPLDKKALANLRLLQELRTRKKQKVTVLPGGLPLENCYKKRMETKK